MNPQQIIHDPKEIPERFKKAWNQYNARGITDLFVDNADFVNVSGKWWESKKEIFEMHDFGLRVIFQHSKMEVVRVKLKMLSDDIATVHAHIKITGQTPKEVEIADKRETIFLFVAKKINGHWLCESAQNTDIVFGKQTNIRDEDGNLMAVNYKERINLRQ